MCYLISVSAVGFKGSLPEHVRTHGLTVPPTKNPYVLRAFVGVPYNVTDGHCCCSFYLAPATDDRAEGQLGAARARCEKKGWSKAKIDRAIAAKAESRSHSAWDAEFNSAGAVHSLYTGRFDDEAFDVSANLTLEPVSLRWRRVSFPEDAVVTLVRG
jgi:hypothetical protein